MTSLVRRAGLRLVRSRAIGRALRSLAARRCHGLVLVYHHIGAPVPERARILPSITVATLRAHLEALAGIVRLVTVGELLRVTSSGAASAGQPLVAVSFDDDLESHVTTALPELQRLGVPATFFLSGRALHDRGPYWFQRLEAWLAVDGLADVAGRLGVTAATPEALLLACEGNAALRAAVVEATGPLGTLPVLGRAGIEALVTSGMEVGFHTLDHPPLPDLDDPGLARALALGRDTLAGVAGRPVHLLAYPHGRADRRCAAAARAAGYAAALTGRASPIRAGDDPFLLGRWEPGELTADDLVARLAVRLHRGAPPPTG